MIIHLVGTSPFTSAPPAPKKVGKFGERWATPGWPVLCEPSATQIVGKEKSFFSSAKDRRSHYRIIQTHKNVIMGFQTERSGRLVHTMRFLGSEA